MIQYIVGGLVFTAMVAGGVILYNVYSSSIEIHKFFVDKHELKQAKIIDS